MCHPSTGACFSFFFFAVSRGGNDTDTIAGCETEGARDTVDREMDGWTNEWREREREKEGPR